MTIAEMNQTHRNPDPPCIFHMERDEHDKTVVRLVRPGPVGGLCVRDCPHPEQLAKLIAAGPALVRALLAAWRHMQSCGAHPSYLDQQEAALIAAGVDIAPYRLRTTTGVAP